MPQARAERGSRALSSGLLLGLILAACPGPARAGWEADYRRGKEALEEGDFEQAIKMLGRAVRGEHEEQRKAKSDAVAGRWIHDYYPHFYLGLAHARHGDCERAGSSWRESLRQGVVPDWVQDEIQQGLRNCGRGGGTAPPRGAGGEERIGGGPSTPPPTPVDRDAGRTLPLGRPGTLPLGGGPTGACCRGGNDCVDGVTEAECNGRFQAGESCRTILCYVPGLATGACCRGSDCVDGVTIEECHAWNGRFVVDGNCARVDCRPPDPMGACCIFGECDTLTELDCEALGGRFLGPNADCPRSGACDDSALGELGGCCLGDNCVELSAASCRDEGGRFLGAGARCRSGRCGTRTAADSGGSSKVGNRSESTSAGSDSSSASGGSGNRTTSRAGTKLRDDPSRPPRDRAEGLLFGSNAGGDQRAASEAVLRVLGGSGTRPANEEVLLALAHFNLSRLAETSTQSEDHESHASRHARLALREGLEPALLDPSHFAPHFRRWIAEQAR